MVKAHKWRSLGLAGFLLGGIVALLAAFLVRSRRPRQRFY
jgi:hypothetical protein